MVEKHNIRWVGLWRGWEELNRNNLTMTIELGLFDAEVEKRLIEKKEKLGRAH